MMIPAATSRLTSFRTEPILQVHPECRKTKRPGFAIQAAWHSGTSRMMNTAVIWGGDRKIIAAYRLKRWGVALAALRSCQIAPRWTLSGHGRGAGLPPPMRSEAVRRVRRRTARRWKRMNGPRIMKDHLIGASVIHLFVPYLFGLRLICRYWITPLPTWPAPFRGENPLSDDAGHQWWQPGPFSIQGRWLVNISSSIP